MFYIIAILLSCNTFKKKTIDLSILRTSLLLIRTVAKSNFQAVECKIKLGWFHIAVALSD